MDAMLMKRYCDGEAGAFRPLYDQVRPKLVSYARRLVGDAAEDVVQETFLRVHEKRSAWRRGTDPMPWFYTIARNVSCDERRRRARTPLALVPEQAERGTEPTAESEVAARQVLAKLPPPSRRALELVKLEGLSHAEAARRMGATEVCVRVRAHRALKVLKRAHRR